MGPPTSTMMLEPGTPLEFPNITSLDFNSPSVTDARNVFSAPSTPMAPFALPPANLSHTSTISPLKRPVSQPSPSPPHKKSKNTTAVSRTSSEGNNTGAANVDETNVIIPTHASDYSPTALGISPDTTSTGPTTDSHEVPPPLVIDRFVRYPRIDVYNIHDPSAESNYTNIVRPLMIEYCVDAFEDFALGMMYAGYTEETATPAVLVVSSAMTTTHALNLRRFLLESNSSIYHCFAYAGATERGDDADPALQDFIEDPSMGASLGTVGLSGSFSLGMYVRLEGHKESFVVSVHHGVSVTSDSITPDTSPPIVVQQPSMKDYQNNIAGKEYIIERRKEGPWSKITQGMNGTSALEEELAEYRKCYERVDFGIVEQSEMCTLDFEGKKVSSDWCLIRLTSDRYGDNKMRLLRSGPDHARHVANQVPCNGSDYFVCTEDTIRVGQEVYKQGRGSGRTYGQISFMRFDCLIPGNGCVTSEYAVGNSTGRFSVRGDSGAGVMTTNGCFVGHIFAGTEGERVVVSGQEHLGPLTLSYIEPWLLTKRQIENATGEKVILGKLSQEATEEMMLKLAG
jgi:hypothetical protein